MNILILAGLCSAWGQDVDAPETVPTDQSPVEATLEQVGREYIAIAPIPELDFFPARPELEEDCLKVAEHWASQKIASSDISTLCGATAKKRAIADELYEATSKNEVTTVFWAGHAIKIDDVVYLVPSDGFDPGLETKESLIGLDDGELASMFHPDVQTVIFIIDTVTSKNHDPPLVGLDQAKRSVEFTDSSILYYIPSKADASGSTLFDGTPVCWQSDKVRPYTTDTDPGDRLFPGEFVGCMVQASRDPLNEWSGRVDAVGMWTLAEPEVKPVLQDYDAKPVRTREGPQLADRRQWAIVGGGYALSAIGLVGGLVATNHYNTYVSQLHEMPFQGSPNDYNMVLGQADAAERNMMIGYGTAIGAATLTTTYLYVRGIKKKRAENKDLTLGPAPVLIPWVSATSVGFTYQF